jgi:hypothetical protein
MRGRVREGSEPIDEVVSSYCIFGPVLLLLSEGESWKLDEV